MPSRRHRTPFFPPTLKPEHAGLGVSEDSLDPGDRTKTGEPIGIIESTLFSHPAILQSFWQIEKGATSSNIVVFQMTRVGKHLLAFTESSCFYCLCCAIEACFLCVSIFCPQAGKVLR